MIGDASQAPTTATTATSDRDRSRHQHQRDRSSEGGDAEPLQDLGVSLRAGDVTAHGLPHRDDRGHRRHEREDRQPRRDRRDRAPCRVRSLIEGEDLVLLVGRQQVGDGGVEVLHAGPIDQGDPEIGGELVDLAVHDVVERRAGEEAAVGVLDDVIGSADHTHHVQRERGTSRRKVVLGQHLFGSQGGDVDLVTDVHSDQRSRRLVHDHLLGAIWVGSPPAEDPEALDLHSHAIVTGDPDGEVGLHAVDQREHDRERTRPVDHRQVRDVVDDLGIDGTQVGGHVGRARLLDEALEAGGSPAGSPDRRQDDRAREAGQER